MSEDQFHGRRNTRNQKRNAQRRNAKNKSPFIYFSNILKNQVSDNPKRHLKKKVVNF